MRYIIGGMLWPWFKNHLEEMPLVSHRSHHQDVVGDVGIKKKKLKFPNLFFL